MGRHNTFHCSICAKCTFKIQIHFAGRPFYQISVLGFKDALCVAYMRILSRGQRLYRIIVWAVMITCIAGHVACTLVLIFQCRPVSISPRWSSLHLILTTFKVQKSWIPATTGSCLADVPTFAGLAIVTIVYDIIYLLFTHSINLGITDSKTPQDSPHGCLFARFFHDFVLFSSSI
jgi:hypothetical protein